MEKFTWKASEPQTYDQRYEANPPPLIQNTFNKNAGTSFTMNRPKASLTLEADEPTSWPQTTGECQVSILQGSLSYTWSSPDSVRVLNIGRTGGDHTVLDIESALNIGDDALLSFDFAQATVHKDGTFNVTGQETMVSIYSSSLTLRNRSSAEWQSSQLKGQHAEVALSNDSRMALFTKYMLADEGGINITVTDNARLAIKAEHIYTLRGSNLVFNLSGELSGIEFGPSGHVAPFDFTMPRSAENLNLITFNFITGAGAESNKTEIIFEGFKGRDLTNQKEALLANGYLSYNGKVITDKEQKIFTLYASQFTGRIEVSLME
ncbi:hypothetical protein QCD58_004960 [Enterobacter hormaechei]|nr:hypothetical protein [Enterobacter hormaechei]